MQRGAREKASLGDRTARNLKLSRAVDRVIAPSRRHGTRGMGRGLESLEQRQLLANTVVINEFMADQSNQSNILKLSDGSRPDWIELYNPTGAAVSLDGWKLKDSAATWPFPATASIAPGGYLVVVADQGE